MTRGNQPLPRTRQVAWHCLYCFVEWRGRPGTDETRCWSCDAPGSPGILSTAKYPWSNPSEGPQDIIEEDACP
jgi:hypothetical protein